MRWQIEQFVFCDQQQSLSDEQGSIQLEPMVVELLRYFCSHPDQILSRQQLIDNVWAGRVVSDNAVARIITKLRKALNDDVKQPRFIATFPKKGYKFIARCAAMSDETNLKTEDKTDDATENATKALMPTEKDLLQNQITPHIPARRRKILWSVVAMLVLAASVLIFSGNTPPPVFTQAKKLTHSAGMEFFPATSPDATRLAFMSAENGEMQLRIKDLATQTTVTLAHEGDVAAGPLSWRADSKEVVYLVASPDRCQYFSRAIDGLELGAPRLLHNCPPGSYGRIIYSHDPKKLIYAQSEGANTPYSLFELNLNTEEHRRLNQPALHLLGNSQFDLHPYLNKLLVSSPDAQQWEGFYQLDLETDEYELLFKQDAYICCGIWDQSGQRIVLMGEHPSQSLISYDLSGQDAQQIFASSQRINLPARHGNGVDYVFIAGQPNMNIHEYDLDSGKKQMVRNLTVDESLATYSPINQDIAFVSKVSGSEELWIKNRTSGTSKKITHFDDDRHYFNLVWSPDGSKIAAMTLNQIHIIDVLSGENTRLAIPQSEIQALSFKTPEIVSYSVRLQGQWRNHLYDLNSQRVSLGPEQWQFVLYQANPDDTLWIDQSGALWFGAEPQLVSGQLPATLYRLRQRQFSIQKSADLWVWLSPDRNGQLMYKNGLDGSAQLLPMRDIRRFHVLGNSLIYDQSALSSTDIVQTVSP